MTSEIIEEKDEETGCFVNTEAEKKKIRKIIQYQKSMYLSSSSSSSLASASAASASASSSFSLLNKSASLLDLMRSGDTSLRRLFDMEHTSLATHLQEYCCSPVTKTIPLWGSETDDEMADPWAEIKQTRNHLRNDGVSKFASDGSSMDPQFRSKDNKRVKLGRRRLSRTRSFSRLPGLCLLRGRGFRLNRLRIMICGKLL